MPKDLTAILLPEGQLSDDEIRRTVIERGFGDVLVRVAPLPAVKLVQVEVHDAKEGMPCEDPELVGRLSHKGRAAFVHVNHTAKQAVVHAFVEGKPIEGFAGEPGAPFEAKLAEALAATHALDAITAADDGSRLGIGISSTRTTAFVRGALLQIPPGTPTDFQSFTFHDRGAGLDEGEERLALFAFHPTGLKHMLEQPGRELAAHLSTAPVGLFGPLEAVRAELLSAIAALGDGTISTVGAEAGDVRMLELCALAAGLVFAGGDAVPYWDERVLPVFSLAAADPVIDPSEVDDLDDCDSLLHAMLEVQPFAAPPGGEGALLSQLADEEVAPLAPWARPGEEYAGSIFLLRPDRLLPLVRALDAGKLRAALEKFERVWYRAARPGQSEGDALANWRRAKSEEGQPDLERFLRDWTELRIVLELSAANGLAPALLFYEGA